MVMATSALGLASAEMARPRKVVGDEKPRTDDVDGVGRGEFAAATVRAASELRAAFTKLIGAVPGGASKPRELQRRLEIDYWLAWRVMLLVNENEPIRMAGRVPKKPSVRRLLEAAAEKGIDQRVIDEARNAAEKFEETVRTKAGSRATFDSIVSAMTPGVDGGQIDAVERRTAFRANSHIWGTQLDLFASATIAVGLPSGNLSRCAVSMRLGFKRFRRGAKAIAYGRNTEDVSLAEPLDPVAQKKYGGFLLPDWSSSPMPELKSHPSSDGLFEFFELRDDTLGQASAVDLTSGSKLAEDPPWGMRGDRRYDRLVVMFRTPVARCILDYAVHRPTMGNVIPQILVTDQVFPDQKPSDISSRDLLPIGIAVQRVEGGLASADTAAAPRYGELLRWACLRMGWDRSEFDLYRVVMDYPVLHTSAVLEVEY